MLSEQEIKQYFHDYYNLLCNYAAKIVDCPEDAVQEVFGSLWKRRDSETKINNIKTYLLGAVHRKCLEINRNNRIKIVNLDGHAQVKEVVSEENEEDFESEMEKYLLKERIYRSIRQLSPKCQHIFVLAKIEGKSYKEIAESLNISTKTIESHINRAYKELRELLNDKTG